jgi:hypothetical protein
VHGWLSNERIVLNRLNRLMGRDEGIEELGVELR